MQSGGGNQSSGMGYGNTDRLSHGGGYGERTNNLYEQQRVGSREIDKVRFRPRVERMYLLTCGPQVAVPANMQMQQHQANLANNSQRKQSHSHASNFQVQSLDSMVSANAFANGSNQNSGNMMTGRSSTRRIAAPGGNSSLSLGWGGALVLVTQDAVLSGLPSTNTNKNYSNASSLSHNYNQNVGNRIRDNVTGYTTLQRAQNFTL